ncbi:MAG: sulfite exporter TauE/SafE family protein [Alphaproteobacteria bacterium]|nr:sulfite exporter TauE/SafE family protein [Alphaproteobacteria bacterium]
MISHADLVVAAAAFFGAFVSGLTGFAFGLVVLGAWLHVIPPSVAGPMVVICGIFAQSVSFASVRRHVDGRRLWPFLAGGLVGIPIGVWLLGHVDAALFKRGVGVFLVLTAGYQLFGRAAVIGVGGRPADGAVGFVGGIMSGMAGLSGAVPTLWAMMRGWPKDQARAVYQPFNMVILAVTLLGLWAAGALNGEHLHYVWIVAAPVAVGAMLGLVAYRWIDAELFRRIVLFLLLASGAALVL